MKKSNAITENKGLTTLFKTLLSTIQSLTLLIEKENKLLSQGQGVDISKLLEQKQELVSKLQVLEENTKASVKEEASNELKELGEKITKNHSRLQEVMRENKILLKSNIIVSNKIIDAYKTKHLQYALSQFGYDKEGQLPALLKNWKKLCLRLV